MGSEGVGISPDDLNDLVLKLEALVPSVAPAIPGLPPPIGSNLIERIEALEVRLTGVESNLIPINSTLNFLVIVLLSLISSLNGLIVLLLELRSVAFTIRDLVIPAVEERVTEVDDKIDKKTFDVTRLTASGDWIKGHQL